MEIRNIAIIALVVTTLFENPRFSTVASASLIDLISDTGKLEFLRPLSANVNRGSVIVPAFV